MVDLRFLPEFRFFFCIFRVENIAFSSANSHLIIATPNSELPAGRTISGVFLKNRHFSPIASVFLCGVFALYCISLKLSESTVFNHVFLMKVLK